MAYTPDNPYIPGDPYSYDLKWIVDKLKEAISLYQPLNDKFDNLYDYVHDYFANLDLTEEVQAIIDQMEADGFFDTLITQIVTDSGTIESTVTAWLTAHVDPVGSAVVVDDTLTIAGAAADAKAAGDRISTLEVGIIDAANGRAVTVPVKFNSGFINTAGTVVASTSYVYSDAIPVETNAVIKYQDSSASSSVLLIASYDSADNILVKDSLKGGMSSGTFTLDSDVKKIRFCAMVSNSPVLQITVPEAKTSDSTPVFPEIFKNGDELTAAILESDGSITPQAATSNQRVTDLLSCVGGIKYLFKSILPDGSVLWPRKICTYDANGTLVRNIGSASILQGGELITYANEEKLRFNWAYTAFSENYIKPEITAADLNANIIVPETYGFTPRRPLIAFIFDGMHDLNDERVEAVNAHGYPCSIAPQYVLADSATEYLYYMRKWFYAGNEIITHGHTVLDSSVPEATGAAIIRDSYDTLYGRGFKPYGFIASNGTLDNIFYPYVKENYDWGACVANRSGSQTAYHTIADDPYQLWRYSMQLSTLAEQKNAVDQAIANTGLLLFYAHCKSDDLQNFTLANFEDLLDYIDTKTAVRSVRVMTASDAVADYFKPRIGD